MLIIGHRGAAGLARENTLEGLRAGLNADADILEFDVRLTKDKIPVLVHDFHTLRTHRDVSFVSQLTLKELHQRLKDHPPVLLEQVLDEFFGQVLLNIEIKGHGCGAVVIRLLKEKYIKKEADWGNVIISSFRGNELLRIRKASKSVNLALLHRENPFLFIALHRRLRLTAIGFHRLYINPLALAVAKHARLFVYAYTVNRPQTARMLAQKGIDGVVTDRPDTILEAIKETT